MKNTKSNWVKIIKENKPLKYKGYPIYVSLRTEPFENWNGNDFSANDLTLNYDNETHLFLHIYSRHFNVDQQELIDTIIINLTNY